MLGAAQAQTAVPQRGYTPDVAGANLAETTLSPATVSPSTFGRLFSLPVDGAIYAQPLYMPGIPIPGKGTRNVLYVATMNDSVYAFDADTAGAPLWAMNYASSLPGAAPVPVVDYVGVNSYNNFPDTVGIEGTPVIDTSTNTLYFVTNTTEPNPASTTGPGAYATNAAGLAIVFRLHAVDITTGAEKFGGPVVIQGSTTVAGNTVTFNPALHNQRPALTLSNGQVIVAFGSHEDKFLYAGWVMAYNRSTLALSGIWNAVPTGYGGAVWQSGRPPAVDAAGNIYLITGNSKIPATSTAASFWDGVNNFPQSAVKLGVGNGLSVLDYFTPANYAALEQTDGDFGSAGPSLIAGTNTLLAGGKSGTLYLLNTQNLGQERFSDAGALQSVVGASAGEIFGGPVVWNRAKASGGVLIYDWGVGDALKVFAFNGSQIAPAAPVGSFKLPSSNLSGGTTAYPGGVLALSANGNAGGIVWALLASQSGSSFPQGELHALNAVPDGNGVLAELWNSTQVPQRDDFGLLAKYVPPVATNGKVYVATGSNQVVVYGLLAGNAGGTVTAWPPRQTALGGSADYIITAMLNSGAVATGNCGWSVTGLPPGATGSYAYDSVNRGNLHIAPGPNTPRGTYRLQAVCTAGSIQVSQAVLLEVVDSSPASIAVASADSTALGNAASAAIDGNTQTFWATSYGSSNPGFPHQITLDLGSVQPVSGLSYLPIQDGCAYGAILQYKVLVSTDGVNFNPVTGGAFDYGPDWRAWSGTPCSGSAYPQRQTIRLAPTAARYVQLKALNSVIQSWPWAGATDFTVYTANGTVPVAPGNYVLANRGSGRVMSAPAGSPSGGAVTLSAYAALANQQWTFAAAGTQGYYTLGSGTANELTVAGFVQLAGYPYEIWCSACSAGGFPGQQFSLLPVADGRGFFHIGNLLTNNQLCTDVAVTPTSIGSTVIQNACSSASLSQDWFLAPARTTVP